MPFAIPDFPPQSAPELSAHVRTVVREDVMWNRPIFKAPPLEGVMQAIDAHRVAQELRSIGLVRR